MSKKIFGENSAIKIYKKESHIGEVVLIEL
jgi:hypothetical protein